ncbi:uncharacterized protein LOC141705947 [Apium graveolens]|uniref:uncharacterized protein LOC141705947 n=1 Tax=Apium graveolens TaxID=4045 RepID=UPI003D78DF61
MASNISIDAACARSTLVPSKNIPSGSSSRREMINAPTINSVQRQPKVPPQPTTLSEHYWFDYELPGDYVPFMDDQVTKLASLGHEHWLPFAERLTGWRKQVRTRVSGVRDHFYYHGDKRFRTFKDVKRYIYLGYPPVENNGDKPLEMLALRQPDPEERLIAMA